MSAKSNSLVSRVAGDRVAMALTGALVVFAAAFIYNAVVVLRTASHESRYVELTGELRVLSQQIYTRAREANDGNSAAFGDLAQAANRFDSQLNILKGGDPERGLPPLKNRLPSDVGDVEKVWQELSGAVDTIVANRDRILFLHEVAHTLNASIPDLQREYGNVVEVLMESGAPADQVALAQKQAWLAERVARNVDRMLTGGAGAQEAADQFNSDAGTFGAVLAGMLDGNPSLRVSRVDNPEARRSLEQINKLFAYVSSSVENIYKASPDLLKARTAGETVASQAPRVLDATSRLVQNISSLEQGLSKRSLLVFGVIIALVIAALGLQQAANTRRRLDSQRETNERNQNAILKLLDELSTLADGDLTVTATVSEDFTGAIADSINFTIENLRTLVSQINETAVKVSSASEETQNTALHLAEASEHQAQEIAGASAAINEMAVTIDQVSANALESAQVADRSVAIAKTGAEVVQNTIHGMDNIREQIQETAKRIKRLGESSQEIGDIVSLINDIADQTNILALNAAIQASMAGDAGRGFAVVADEVQRLAERSSGATKQIEALVKTIQSDTNEAVISMEQTTAEVVRGARLAQDAGVALEEIEKVSTDLAELIQNISNAARQQASSASHMSRTMAVIQEITQQTSAGTITTARSIGKLTDLAGELKGSVAGFKLPGDAGSFH